MSNRKGPNLQNIPVGKGETRRVSEHFRSPVADAALHNTPSTKAGMPELNIASDLEIMFFGSSIPSSPEEAKKRRNFSRNILFAERYGKPPSPEEVKALREKAKAGE